jgi:hypothetical protein
MRRGKEEQSDRLRTGNSFILTRSGMECLTVPSNSLTSFRHRCDALHAVEDILGCRRGTTGGSGRPGVHVMDYRWIWTSYDANGIPLPVLSIFSMARKHCSLEQHAVTLCKRCDRYALRCLMMQPVLCSRSSVPSSQVAYRRKPQNNACLFSMHWVKNPMER